MHLLLDTHTFLWYIADDTQLPAAVAAAIEDPANTVYVSIISLWEITIKSSLGKLRIELPLPNFFAKNIDDNGFIILDISRSHLTTVFNLPFHHRGPFDRLLIAQSIADDMIFATGDREAVNYPVARLW